RPTRRSLRSRDGVRRGRSRRRDRAGVCVMSVLPIPAAPASNRPLAIVKTETRRDGVAIVTIEDPRETLNTLTPELGMELTSILDALEKDPKVTSLVLRSGKKDSFVVGANIDFVRAIRFAADAETASREAAKRFLRLEQFAKPVVACVHGTALGGGFEL